MYPKYRKNKINNFVYAETMHCINFACANVYAEIMQCIKHAHTNVMQNYANKIKLNKTK